MLHFKGIPRRSRLVAVAFFVTCLVFLLPKADLGIGKTISFFLFGSDTVGPYRSTTSNIDVLQFVDPLIGTANGGAILGSPFVRVWTLTRCHQDMSFPGQLYHMVS